MNRASEHFPEGSHELLVDNPVFFEALEIQELLSKINYNDPSTAFNAAKAYAEQLDLRLENTDIGGQISTITGGDIVMPVASYDIKLGAYDFVSQKLSTWQEKEDIPNLSVYGSFYGFGAYVTEDIEDEGMYHGGIAYQVIYRKIATSNYTGSLVATAPVDKCTIEFLADRKQRDADQALTNLRTVQDAEVVDAIQKIDDLLTDDNNFSQSNLRRLARIACRDIRTMSNANVTQKHQEALMNLIRARLGLYEEQIFTIKALSGILKRSGNTLKVTRPFEEEVAVHGVTITPHYWREKDAWHSNTDIHQLALIVQSKDGESEYLEVPIEKIQGLKPHH